MLVQLWKEANEAPEAFMDHAGIMRDARTGKSIESVEEEEKEKEGEEMRQLYFARVALHAS